MGKEYDLSIIIPTFREEKRIERCITESLFFFRNNARIKNFEIIFVADKSGDKTPDIIKNHLPENPELKLLVNEERLQKGFSVRRGALEAKHDIVMFYDVDLSTPLYETNKFLDFIDDYDILIASRGMKDSKVEKKWSKIFWSRGFSLMKRILFGINFKDTQCGFKMFKGDSKKVFEKQTIRSSAFDVELLFIAKKLNYRINELPVTWIDSDMSNFNTIKVIVGFLSDMFQIFKANMRGRYDDK